MQVSSLRFNKIVIIFFVLIGFNSAQLLILNIHNQLSLSISLSIILSYQYWRRLSLSYTE